MSDGFSTKGSEKEKRGISPDRRLEPKPKLQPLQGSSSEPSDLHFDRLQPSDKECDCEHKRVFRAVHCSGGVDRRRNLDRGVAEGGERMGGQMSQIERSTCG
ncbi:uncharacterized protein M6B38_208120 [Iris pallida]|uniref:Uncharacterized protein n=1 Tax=Iris pallida TaxID=29817 RepID=A0AAX6E539_IRIPA|nr:uncharacterized protein M6B38_208120 [Iris pallida]